MLRPLFLVCIVGVLNADRIHYDGHTVYRVKPRTQEEFHHLLEYQQYLKRNRVDIWRETFGLDSPLDFRVSPDKTKVLKNLNLNASVLIPDVESLIQDTMKSNVKSNNGSFDYGVYHNHSEIENWMKSSALHIDYATLFPITTRSYENRTCYGLQLQLNPGFLKPAIWLIGGMHGREWISPATVIYVANQIMEQFNHYDPTVTPLLNTFDLYIVPVVNVDGYEYSWTTDRMWSKTRSLHPGSSCRGVDPERNFDFHFCEGGGSKDPCSNSYCGPVPFSEEVTGAMADHMNGQIGVGLIDFRSYSQMWVTPWGYTTQLPKDVVKQNQSSAAAVAAIEKVHGTKYTYGTIANTDNMAKGSSIVDWAYGSAINVKYPARVELRDTGKYGFLLPPDQIIPTGEETLQGVLAYMNSIKNNM